MHVRLQTRRTARWIRGEQCAAAVNSGLNDERENHDVPNFILQAEMMLMATDLDLI
jgi:hypothetical protein